MNRAGRIPLHPEAFSHDGGFRRRTPRERSQAHLAFIRSLPCVVCGSRDGVQAAHLRAGNPVYGKRRTGLGEKPHDRFANALCRSCHAAQHKQDELAFWRSHGIDPFQVATSLFACSGDDEAAELVIKMARSKG